jgi:hypothetical protein
MHNTYIQPQCPATLAIDRAPTFPPRHTHAPDTSLIPPSYLFTAPNRSDEEHRHHAPVARHPARTHHRRQANTLGRGDEQIPDTNTGIPLPCRVRVVCSSTVCWLVYEDALPPPAPPAPAPPPPAASCALLWMACPACAVLWPACAAASAILRRASST